MNTQKFKEAWLKALRSGQYKQCKRTMARDKYGEMVGATDPDAESFCCLGVGSRLIGRRDSIDIKSVFDHVADMFDPGHGQIRLVAMNDDEDCDFSQIADYIEQNAKV